MTTSTSQPVLTVSVAAYNVEGTIKQALDSVVKADEGQDIEILVIDDGGSDQTLAIAQDYERRFPGQVRAIHKPNAGYGSVINTAIQEGRGRYFRQLDGDDWYCSEHLAQFVAQLKRTQADCVVTARLNINERTGSSELVDCLPAEISGYHQLDDVSFTRAVGMHEITYRTELLQRAGIRLDERCLYTDIELAYLPLASVQTVELLHLPIYCHRVGVNGQSISPAGVRAHYREHEFVFWRMLATYRSMPGGEADGRRKLFAQRLADEICGHFHWFCYLTPNRAHRSELQAFNRRLEAECPELLAQAQALSDRIYWLRRSHFALYGLFCRLEAYKQKG
ncbi:hypothetical protein KIMH_03980 [Bombiscardovia apis]|uniref:Glycosyltransferase 2-like domain-containing protein n=1 Tax=Bombiscardovia apis TaxID=2932182 RepID=A0ABN6SGB6_9BIFI|nr:glycosyltransferase family 2 protein [Bombiscardovia apis]BDR54287.1 hypothetical protein KIMH_03980 [Bombiscardovia apis]